MKILSPSWLLLITNLPGHNPTLRMRTWRALKAAGVGLLRDGAYLLPHTEEFRAIFEEQGGEIKAAGGAAHLMPLEAESDEQRASFVGLFDRSSDYAEIIGRLDAFKGEIKNLTEPEARQRLAGIAREAAAVISRDFFAGEPRKQMDAALLDAEAGVNAKFAPDEPHAAHRALSRRNLKDYRARIWATRERLWIDRVASAWLIRRFIDPKAKFVWLKHVKNCPKRAVGFDFDGAEFTHVGARVTFEVLLASFALESDIGLARLAALVHHLDVGGIPIPEAPGFAAIMAGARAIQPDDDALLKAMSPVLDSLYAGFVGTGEKK